MIPLKPEETLHDYPRRHFDKFSESKERQFGEQTEASNVDVFHIRGPLMKADAGTVPYVPCLSTCKQSTQDVSVAKSYSRLSSRRVPSKKRNRLLISRGKCMAASKILLVDDDEIVRHTLCELLKQDGFDITVAGSVPEALKLITSEQYDVLLSDLHMPGAGDGLTVISAMRHLNPNAVAMLLSSFPEMEVAAQAILRQADEIVLKQTDIKELVKMIKRRLGNETAPPAVAESVATILERASSGCIEDWFEAVEHDSKLTLVPLNREQRCGHLLQVFCDLVARLRSDLPLGTTALTSAAAASHGLARRRQGYSAAMMVEESRILQVCIFHTLQKNLINIDFSVLLFQVMTIADEVDSQLRQAVECYVQESTVDSLPA
jgi:CheY-like chemotaxis protein